MVDILHRVGIKSPLPKVVEALSTVPGVAAWWTRDTTGSSGRGGSMHARFTDPAGKEIGAVDFDVTAADPEGGVQWRFTGGPEEWIGTEATFDLARQDDMTVIIFRHRNWKEVTEFTAHCSMKWATFLLSLRALLETGAGQPAPDDLKISNWH